MTILKYAAGSQKPLDGLRSYVYRTNQVQNLADGSNLQVRKRYKEFDVTRNKKPYRNWGVGRVKLNSNSFENLNKRDKLQKKKLEKYIVAPNYDAISYWSFNSKNISNFNR